MKQILLKELKKLQNKLYIVKDDFNEFNTFLNTNQQFTRPQNLSYHVGAFFLPIHSETNSIYLGHHTKAKDWIPPGGHIELNEHPKDTVIREFKEELSYEPTSESIDLYTVSIEYLKSKGTCKIHYSFWYLVYMDSLINFKFDKREYYDAQWLSTNQATSKTKHTNIKRIIEEILNKHH